VAGVAVAAAGLVLIGSDAGAGVDVDGFLLCLGAGASWAVGNLVARRSGATQGLGLVVWGSVVAAPPLAVLAVVAEGGVVPVARELGAVGGSGVAALAYLVVFATVLGFGTWSALLGRYPAASVAPFTMLVPPVGLAAAWIALGERPSAVALAGSACVVAGLVWPQLAPRRAARAVDREPEPAAGTA
jgi:O-acetylserine/cysteine efflux transporter